MDKFTRQIPNILTVLRMVLSFACFYLAMKYDNLSLFISLMLFGTASLTDFFDGYLARKWQIVTSFGKLMDPIADKMLILGVLLVFSYKEEIPWILTILIVTREVLLTVIRLMISDKVILAARYSGKIKTTVQIAGLTAIYVLVIYRGMRCPSGVACHMVDNIIFVVACLMTLVTIYSGYDFFIHNKTTIIKNLGHKQL